MLEKAALQCGKRADPGCGRFPAPVEKTSRDPFRQQPGLESANELQESHLTLIANDDIDERFSERLLGKQTRMPAAEHNGQIRAKPLHQPARLDGLVDHRASQQRDPETKSVRRLLLDLLKPIRLNFGVDDSNVVPRRQQRRGETEQAQWGTQRRAGVVRQQQDNFPSAGSGRARGSLVWSSRLNVNHPGSHLKIVAALPFHRWHSRSLEIVDAPVDITPTPTRLRR